jgi:hypothetical protein
VVLVANLISTVFDADTKGFRSSMKSLIADVQSADGLTGKFKAGVSGMGDMLKNNAGPIALAAGAALVTFGVKAVAAFENTAKAAIDFGAAVGLSTEQASRWIAVGDDMGVSADQLTTAFGKVAKTLDSGMWEKYGVATRDARGEVRSTNDIILDSFDSLGKITNQTERAKAGNDLFGKGYANLAPLIGKTRAEMEDYLGSVEGGQVITDAEAKKAEKMRLAQDKLKDALNEGTMAVGSFVANLAPLIDGLADTVTWLVSVQDKTEEWARDLAGIGDDVAMGLGKITNAQKNLETGTADYSTIVDDFNRGTGAKYKKVLEDAKDAAEKLDSAVQTIKGHIDERQAWRNATEEVQKLHDMIAAGESSWSEYADQADQAALAVAEVVTNMDNLPDEAKTSLIVALDQGKLDAVNTAIEVFRQGIDMPIYPKVVGGVSINGSVAGKRAAGGPVSAGLPYLVGENGPEIVVPSGSGNVIPNNRIGVGGGGGSITIINNSADPRAVIDIIKRWQAKGGRV